MSDRKKYDINDADVYSNDSTTKNSKKSKNSKKQNSQNFGFDENLVIETLEKLVLDYSALSAKVEDLEKQNASLQTQLTAIMRQNSLMDYEFRADEDLRDFMMNEKDLPAHDAQITDKEISKGTKNINQYRGNRM